MADPAEKQLSILDYAKIGGAILLTVSGSNYGLEHLESQAEERAAQIIADNESLQTQNIADLTKEDSIKTSQINLLTYQLTDALRRLDNLEE